MKRTSVQRESFDKIMGKSLYAAGIQRDTLMEDKSMCTTNYHKQDYPLKLRWKCLDTSGCTTH